MAATMYHSVRAALALALTLLVSTTLVVSARPQQVPVQTIFGPANLPDDPTTAVFVDKCVKCHDVARVLANRRTPTEWEELIRKMIERGAQGSGSEFEQVYEYLVGHFGKVYINVEPAEQIASVLKLSAEEAAAIVAYREANGAFADCEAVKKVPNINAKKIDDLKDAIAF
jgi:competence ComEA-like helix-hairpin-helix protein